MLIAGAVTGLVVAVLVVHGVGMKLTKRTDGGADFETIRKYDQKHNTPHAAEYAAAADKLYDELDAQGLEERKANHGKGGDK
jgi:hydrogenase small subunit